MNTTNAQDATPTPKTTLPAERITITLGRAIGQAGEEVGDARMRHFLSTAIATVVPSFSVIEGNGYWEGMPERTTIVSVVTDSPDTYSELVMAAALYARLFRQDAVMVERVACERPLFVTGEQASA